ncbi:MAG: class I tRNA ligase family protein, partial [Euryarchaeota archaeon]|nr:class I tRNA ligase family protein [Euryarchaeota archaeon]
KSRGNVIEPETIIKDYGADALRFYMMRTNAPWEDIAFQYDGVKNARKTLNVLWNILNFAATYMVMDRFDPATVSADSIRPRLRPEDRWLVSRTERLKNEVTRHFDSFELHKAVRALEEFMLEDLSRWYVRLIRDRMWKEEGDVDKLAAYRTLYDAIMSLDRLLAPFCPHLAEEIYQSLDGSRGSVHMLDWPTPDPTKADDRLEGTMKTVQEIVDIVTRERQARGVKLRWPLRKLAVKSSSKEGLEALRSLESVLASQANLKAIEYVGSEEEWKDLILNVIPNPHAIGKVYRQWSSKIAILLKSRPAMQIKESVAKGEYQLGIEGQMIKIEPNMVSFTTSLPPEVVNVKFSEGEVYIDFKVTPDIEAEGFTRELVRRIQQMRKDAKLDVEEFIVARVRASTKLVEFFKMWKEYISKETRSREIVFTDQPAGELVVEWEVEGETVEIGISSLHTKEAVNGFLTITGLGKEAALGLAEAGYKSIEDLRGISEEILSQVKGVSKADARKIAHFLTKKEFAEAPACPNCGSPVKPGSEICPSCRKSLMQKEGALPKEKLIPYLLRIPRMNKVKAEMLYDAGFDSLGKIVSASKEDVRAVKGIGSKTADMMISYAAQGGFEAETECPKCHSAIPPDALRCPSCGEEVSIEIHEEEGEEAELPS